MPKSTPMDHQSADRISAAAERDPESPTAESGFDDRAQDAADRNDEDDGDDEEGLTVPGPGGACRRLCRAADAWSPGPGTGARGPCPGGPGPCLVCAMARPAWACSLSR